jgi:RHS repeat-associated protein
LTHKFTGKERDSESGLDNFGARYNSSNLGRFMTPDWSASPSPIPFGDISDPQSLNLYSYVRDNPLSRTDPSGHCTIDGEKHGFWWCVGHAFGINETQKEYQARIANERQWLVSNVAQNAAQRNALGNASSASIDKLYWAWSSALYNAACPWYSICEEQPTEASLFHRTANGSFAEVGGGPIIPLSRLHDDATITVGNSASYQFWSGKSTEEIVESLRPDAAEPLRVTSGGKIMNGNTRIKVLEERGFDVNKLNE